MSKNPSCRTLWPSDTRLLLGTSKRFCPSRQEEVQALPPFREWYRSFLNSSLRRPEPSYLALNRAILTVFVGLEDLIDDVVCEGRLEGLFVVNFVKDELFLLLFLVRGDGDRRLFLVDSNIYLSGIIPDASSGSS